MTLKQWELNAIQNVEAAIVVNAWLEENNLL